MSMPIGNKSARTSSESKEKEESTRKNDPKKINTHDTKPKTKKARVRAKFLRAIDFASLNYGIW